MGLDIVEMIMDVEDEFGLAIPDEQAQHIETVGQLYQFVLSRLGKKSADACDSAVTFYRVRRAVVDAGVASRREVHPDFNLAYCFEGMPQAWAFFLSALGLRLPRLSLQSTTVRGFVQTYSYAFGTLADDEIWRRLVTVVASQTGIDSEKIRPDSHFVYDLQMD